MCLPITAILSGKSRGGLLCKHWGPRPVLLFALTCTNKFKGVLKIRARLLLAGSQQGLQAVAESKSNIQLRNFSGKKVFPSRVKQSEANSKEDTCCALKLKCRQIYRVPRRFPMYRICIDTVSDFLKLPLTCSNVGVHYI